MQRIRIHSVIFEAPQSPPGSGVNGSTAVILVESDSLRLECDDVGVVATLLDKSGLVAKVENNPDRWPWARVKKVSGERVDELAPALGTAPEAPKAKRAAKADTTSPAVV